MSDARDSIRALFGPLDEASTAELDRRLDVLAAEVRRGDADRLHDERKQYRGRDRFCGGIEHAARLLRQWAEKTTTPAEAAPDFFEPGHTYTHRDGTSFHCVAVTNHLQTGERLAMGWHIDSWALHYPATVGINQWNHEYDGVQAPTSTEDGAE